ncbi:hypothetical protein GMDG_08584 [Pseudogymnoascus destructans 20631-21]|uniref:CCHC-type domain-containing protein n=1 Tax=Pseudogymnoascus destructans (strain ATCC MYA-4855 / 20631-21) TaxID=658429 RepID=L8G593_PSED2|nr:hypothetical protein GMDG_08584 [Pseudogymnoascus destructans 20631-21]
MTGLAKTYLEHQYLSATHGFRSAEEMMHLLGSYYLTGNETEQARNLFDDLQIGEKGHASETFPEFKARFQSAAITGQVSESEWFQYMWNKLTPQFRSRVAIIKNQWNGDYQTMCGKPGHFQDKCPLNATVKEIDRNDPEAEEQWEEAVELQSDASIEENDEA